MQNNNIIYFLSTKNKQKNKKHVDILELKIYQMKYRCDMKQKQKKQK